MFERHLNPSHRYMAPVILAAAAHPFIAAGLAGAAGYTASKAAQAAKAGSSTQASPVGVTTPTAAQTVDATSSATSQNNARGRAALISTSASGVLGTDPTGRRRVLGN